MSMNLIFDVKGTTACVDFPYQTKTNFTYAVLAEPDVEVRLSMIKADIECRCGDDLDQAAELYQEVIDLMKVEALELSII